ncbi:C40 family peptidase [uncultured Clostridium sp.]|uniref:C40 family peptidase n=1 Tax=uncultured Clostridium sp. TaxID=59620 RepID=UPI0025F0A5B4|nr:C40 family peptidase [uncultured Clostridium sp.]
MFKQKDNDYLASLNRARKKRNRGDYKKYALIAAGVAVVIGIAVFAGMKLRNKEAGGKPGKTGDVNVSSSESAESPEEASKAAEANEKKAVIDSYTRLGIVQVTGYLNMRESASTDANVIGKLQGDSACEILDDSIEGWYQISSGGLTGYISSEFVLTGDEAKAKAEELVVPRAIITVDALNIRKEPSIESDAVGQALKNERYVIEEDNGDGWYKIPSGYISSEYSEKKYALNEARKLDMKSMVLNLYKNIGISSVDNYLNVREEPSEDGKIIGKMTSKSAGEILETTEDGQWYKIHSGPVTGYVKAEYILTGGAAKDEALNVAELMAIVSTDRLNVRTEPSTDSQIWTQISNNERYAVLKQTDGWVEIELDSTSAYVSTDFVDVRYALPEAIKFTPLDENVSLRNKIVNYAIQFVGGKYVWGGNDPHTGADCSGFVKYVYSHVAGISLNRVSRDQARQGKQIKSGDMKPGDLIFYTNSKGTINHVAMYIGNGQIVHAASRRSGIKISTWNYRNPYRIINLLGD